MWAIFFYIAFSFATDVLLNFIIRGQSTRVLRFFIFSAFTFFEYSIFSYFFYEILTTRNFKRIVSFFYPAFILVAIYSVIYRKEYNFDSFTAQIESIHIILFSVLFFYEQLNKPEITFVYATKNFWIVTSILFYLSATIFLFILSIYLTKRDIQRFWAVNDMSNIIKNIFFAIAFAKPTETGKIRLN